MDESDASESADANPDEGAEAEATQPDESNDRREPALEGAIVDNGEAAGEAPIEEPPPEPTAEEQLAKAREELSAMRERMLRVAADFDNYRKRSSREAEEARRRGVQSALRDLLPVFDNLERATAHVDASSDIESLLDGLRMVHKLFLDTLGRLGIERVAGIGSAFDPMVHEGIQHDYSDEHPAGAVAAELQPGYRMAGELIRPALVVVSRGPRPEEPAAGEPSEPPAVAEADTASDDVEG